MIQQNTSQIFHYSPHNLQKIAKSLCYDYGESTIFPLKDIYSVNEILLTEEEVNSYNIENTEDWLIIPIQGGLDYEDNKGKAFFFHIGQSYFIREKESFSFSLKNPYKEGIASYIIIRFITKKENTSSLQTFDIAPKNVLWNVYQNDSYHVTLGIYEGRKEGEYLLNHLQKNILTFVIHGAFEFQNRLIEKQDALILWNVDKIEFEALSRDAILCMIVF